MVHFNTGHHHLHKRKRIYKKHEPYPHPNKWKNLLDRIMYPVGLIGPFMMIPQILKIYIEKDASSIALSSWLLFLIPASLWVIYGFSNKDKVIICCNLAWLIAYLFTVVGAILY
jgi:uncharacterized protein with PQ loop repeat